MEDLQVFNNDAFGQIRILEKDNELWFVAKDVADTLGYQNGSRDVNRHTDEEDRIKTMVFDGNQNKETISETFTFCRSDGRLDSKITTKWTQKGRLEIHNILSNLDIHAVCENVA